MLSQRKKEGVVTEVSEDLSTPSHELRKCWLALVGVLAVAAIVYFLSYNPARFGLSHDDGIYVSTAKALAQGDGYRLISLPSEPAQTKYPPLYPLLLSLIWRVDPQFPSNVNAMVVLSAVATLVFLGVTWTYLVKQGYTGGWQALAIVFLAAVNWRTIILATTTYSEMIYSAFSVIGLHLAEGLDKRRDKRIPSIALGLVLGLAFLTRSAGVSLIVAVAAYLLIGKRFRQAVVPVLIGSLFVAGWLGWSYVNRTQLVGLNVAYYTSYLGHLKEVLFDLQAHDQTSTAVTLLNALGANALMLVVISVPIVCLAVEYNLVVYLGFAFLFIAAGFVRQVKKGWRLLHIYIVCYLIVHLFWLPYVSYDRFLIPVLPFLLLWGVRELETMASLARKTLTSDAGLVVKGSASLIGIAFAAMVSVSLYNYGSNLYYSASAPLKKEVKALPDDAEAFEWIRANTGQTDVLACDRDPIYYLFTGRKAIHSLPMSPGIDWQKNPKPIFDIVRQNNGKYLVITASDFEFENLKRLVDARQEAFAPVFSSANGRSSIYRIQIGVE